MKKMLLLASLLFSAISVADEQSVDQLKYKLARLNTFQASFQSHVVDANKKAVGKTGEGYLTLKQPSLFRFETQAPSRAVLIGDGTSLWNYDIDMEQVNIYDARKEVAQTPFVLLTSTDKALWAQYDVTMQGETFVIVSKKADNPVKSLTLSFSGTGLSQMVVHNSDGQVGTFDFVTSQVNRPVDASEFKFTPPAGVEVEDLRSK